MDKDGGFEVGDLVRVKEHRRAIVKKDIATVGIDCLVAARWICTIRIVSVDLVELGAADYPYFASPGTEEQDYWTGMYFAFKQCDLELVP